VEENDPMAAFIKENCGRIKTGDVVEKCLQNQEQCTKGDSSEEEEKRKRRNLMLRGV
jgi:hypothetical protein